MLDNSDLDRELRLRRACPQLHARYPVGVAYMRTDVTARGAGAAALDLFKGAHRDGRLLLGEGARVPPVLEDYLRFRLEERQRGERTERRAMRPAEWRTIPAAGLRVDSTPGRLPRLTGYAAKWEPAVSVEIGELRECVARGCFRDCLRRRDPLFALVNHDVKQDPLGNTIRGTLRVEEDADGLRFTLDPPDNRHGRDVVRAVREGRCTGASIGFVALDDAIVESAHAHRPILLRRLLAADLREVSLTLDGARPAYPSTSVTLST